jgi:hypothetical protein
LVALTAALASGLAVLLLAGGPATGGAADNLLVSPTPHWWKPPRDVRVMLRAIDPARLQSDVQTLVGFGTRHSASSQTDPVRGVGAAGQWITNELQQAAATSGGDMTVQRQTFVQPVTSTVPVPTTMTNIIATLRGTDPTALDRVYVVSAHYDSRATDVLNFTSDAPGADRDASGVAAMLELARVMAAHPAKATIVFAAFDGEEQGLFGSSFFAQQSRAAGSNIQADLNMDIIGSSLGGNGIRDPYTVRLFSEGIPSNASAADISFLQSVGGEDDGVSRQLARYVKETGENSATGMDVALVSRRDRILRGGDQISFLQQGFPAVRLTEPNEDYNHEAQDVRVAGGVQFGDLPQFLDYGYMARVTKVVGSALAALASAPRAPTHVSFPVLGPPGFQGSNDTVLRWSANPESDVVGYVIVWRESSQETWTHALNVGNVTQYTLTGLNKDDLIFGVRAVNRNGQYSPVAYAVPGTT